MSKAYLTQRGVILVKEKFPTRQIQQIKKELTVQPEVQKEYQFNCKQFEVFIENNKKIAIPRFFAQEKGIDFSFERIPEFPKKPRLKFQGELRSIQKDAKKAYLEANKNKGGGIISLQTGMGKTVVALDIICEIQQKTLILVHQTFLMNQWRDRIQEFIPKARIGFIQQDKFEVANKDIIIAMIQTVCKRDFTVDQQAQLKQISLCVVDEAHHLSGEHFNKAMFKTASRNMLGLTATPRRKDKLECVFHWHLGDVVFSSGNNHRRDGLQPVIEFVRYRGVGKDFEEQRNQAGQISVPMMLSKIVKNKERNEFVIAKINDFAKNDKRHCLVLSDRRTHLQVMERMFRKKYPTISTGFYIGGMSETDLKESESKRVIFATYSMVSEAFDLPSLNTLFLTTARSDVEQSVGRILRKAHEEAEPTIIDFCDVLSIFIAQGRKRVTFYKSRGYRIKFSSNDILGKRKPDEDDESPFQPKPKQQKIKKDQLLKIFQDTDE